MVLGFGEGYTMFFGRNIEQMPLLRQAGLVPMSVAQVMQRRLAVLCDDLLWESTRFNHFVIDPNVLLDSAWFDSSIRTGDAVAYKDNKIKIVLDAQPLREINLESKLRENGELLLPDGVYETLEGPEFRRNDLVCGRYLSQREVHYHPGWRVLARDQNVLDEYADVIFKQAKKRYGYNDNMGLFLIDTCKNKEVWGRYVPKQPTLQTLCLNSLSGWSNAVGSYSMTNVNGVFIGIPPRNSAAQH